MPFLSDIDALDRLLGRVAGEEPALPVAAPAGPIAVDKTSPFFQPCAHCRGTGSYGRMTRLGHSRCNWCKGTGGKMGKTTVDERAHTKALAEARKAKKSDAAVEDFAKLYPAEAAYIGERKASFGFCQSMDEALRKWGHLTEGQLNGVRKGMLFEAERALRKEAEAKEREASSTVITGEAIDRLFESLAKASAKGLKKPALRFEGFTVSKAGEASKNAGGLYLKDGGTYLGKIVAGRYMPTSEAVRTPGLADKIAAAMENPVEAARAFGRRTGHCSCCGRLLTDPVSVANGIGPICESSYF